MSKCKFEMKVVHENVAEEGEFEGRCRAGLTCSVITVFGFPERFFRAAPSLCSEIHKFLELQVDSRKRCGACVGSGASVPGVCLIDPCEPDGSRCNHVLASRTRHWYTG